MEARPAADRQLYADILEEMGAAADEEEES